MLGFLALIARLLLGLLLLPLFLLLRLLHRDSNVVNFDLDDPGMEAAKAEARRTVHELIARLDAGDRLEYPAVKAALPVEGGSTEHVWLSDVRYEEGMFVGTIGNVPQHASGFSEGEVMRVSPAEISDWSYVEDSLLVGGYTIRYIRSQMSPAQRKRLDASVPFRIELAA